MIMWILHYMNMVYTFKIVLWYFCFWIMVVLSTIVFTWYSTPWHFLEYHGTSTKKVILAWYQVHFYCFMFYFLLITVTWYWSIHFCKGGIITFLILFWTCTTMVFFKILCKWLAKSGGTWYSTLLISDDNTMVLWFILCYTHTMFYQYFGGNPMGFVQRKMIVPW